MYCAACSGSSDRAVRSGLRRRPGESAPHERREHHGSGPSRDLEWSVPVPGHRRGTRSSPGARVPGFRRLVDPRWCGRGHLRRCHHASSAPTTALPVVTGILNVWMHDAAEVASEHARIGAAYPERFLLGLGVSHASLIEAGGDRRYERPLRVMKEYLDALDVASPPVRQEDRVLAALGPKMLELARDRSAGAHPYLTTPRHTGEARATLGSGPLLAPEQMVVLDPDLTSARATARHALARYLALPNYTNNLKRLGFGDADLADGGSRPPRRRDRRLRRHRRHCRAGQRTPGCRGRPRVPAGPY